MTPAIQTTEPIHPPAPAQLPVVSPSIGASRKYGQSSNVGSKLRVIHGLQNQAVYLWGRCGKVLQSEACFLEALRRLHDFCTDNLSNPDTLPNEMYSRRRHSTACLFQAKRIFGGDQYSPQYFGFTLYNHAFVLNNLPSDCGLDDVLLTASTLHYNVALFYHAAWRTSDGIGSMLHGRLANEYYKQAIRFAEQYEESTRKPIWHLQASINYNFAMLYRDLATRTFDESQLGNFYFYIDQVSLIANWVQDREARKFFSCSIQLMRLKPVA